ncbi:MAG: hydantoinase B/oxoprolinase family protein, partial [Chloroflexi bacterium]|nr:hydantoinase B/oxoprolinase family protein [Chloroflexota bacterium]
MPLVNAIDLEVFRHRCNAIAEEMGAALERSAFSANIHERR